MCESCVGALISHCLQPDASQKQLVRLAASEQLIYLLARFKVDFDKSFDYGVQIDKITTNSLAHLNVKFKIFHQADCIYSLKHFLISGGLGCKSVNCQVIISILKGVLGCDGRFSGARLVSFGLVIRAFCEVSPFHGSVSIFDFYAALVMLN